jgi:ferric-dicitrate binding protein FerR (iron transport regulator)
MLLCITVTLFIYSRYQEPQTTKVILPDGTLVWLKKDAVLDYSDDLVGRKREVTLQGEGLFEIARDPSRPFVIHCGKYIATAIGTSFNIKSANDRIELTVLTGRVRLAYENDSAIIVNPSQHVILKVHEVLQQKTLAPEQALKVVSANTGYDMHFEDTQMREIVKRIESKFDVTINIDDKTLLDCMISADFTDQSLPVTLTMISQALGTTYTVVGDEVTITGVGCDK